MGAGNGAHFFPEQARFQLALMSCFPKGENRETAISIRKITVLSISVKKTSLGKALA
jgi:hypothetical protein